MEKEIKLLITIVIVALLLLVVRTITKTQDSEIISHNQNIINEIHNNETMTSTQNILSIEDKYKNNTSSVNETSLSSLNNLYEIVVENPKEGSEILTTTFVIDLDSSITKITKENVLEIDKSVKERFTNLYSQFESGISSYEYTKIDEVVGNGHLTYAISGKINEYSFITMYNTTIVDVYGIHGISALSYIELDGDSSKIDTIFNIATKIIN